MDVDQFITSLAKGEATITTSITASHDEVRTYRDGRLVAITHQYHAIATAPPLRLRTLRQQDDTPMSEWRSRD